MSKIFFQAQDRSPWDVLFLFWCPLLPPLQSTTSSGKLQAYGILYQWQMDCCSPFSYFVNSEALNSYSSQQASAMQSFLSLSPGRLERTRGCEVRSYESRNHSSWILHPIKCWIGTLNNNLEHQAALEPSMTWSCITAWGSTLSPLPWRTLGKSLANQGPSKLNPSY